MMPSSTGSNTPNASSLSRAQTQQASRDSLSQTNSAILKRSMQSLLSRGKAFLTPSSSATNLSKQRNAAAGFSTAKAATDLFPTVDPTIDGEECLHDCSSCTVSLPRKWEIDEADALYGQVKGWDTHLIVATGKTDWVRDVADEKGSLMEGVADYGLERANGKVMLSASDMPTGEEVAVDGQGNSAYAPGGRTRCLVLPKWRMVEGVGKSEVPWLMDEVVGKGASNISPLKWQDEKLEEAKAAPIPAASTAQNGHTNAEQQSQEDNDTPDVSELTISQSRSAEAAMISNNTTQLSAIPTSLNPPSGITLKQCPHRAVILMCSHKTRDWRCGASAPLLRREFERHLRPLGLYRDLHDERPGGVGIYFINHVGGHKYSANVMIYRRSVSSTPSTRTPRVAAETIGAEQINGVATPAGEAELSDEAVQGIWLARVRPEDCENIVKYTVLQGKVVKPQRQLRGGFDRATGLISW